LFIQKFASFNQEIKNCSNVDETGNCTVEAQEDWSIQTTNKQLHSSAEQ